MKRIVTIVALTCAVAFQVNAQNTVEKNVKAAEQTGFMLNANSREIETAPGASYLWYLQPQTYNDTVKRFEEFINKK